MIAFVWFLFSGLETIEEKVNQETDEQSRVNIFDIVNYISDKYNRV